MNRPQPPPEAVLIRLVREAQGIKIPEAARRAGISKGRWSQVELGYETRSGIVKPVKASAGVIAHMADAVHLPPERLEAEGERPDAVGILREIAAQHARTGQVQGEPPEGRALGAVVPIAGRSHRKADPDGYVRPNYATHPDYRDRQLEALAREIETEGKDARLLTNRDVDELIRQHLKAYKQEVERLRSQAGDRAEIRHLRAVSES